MAAPAKAGTITFTDVARTIGASGHLSPATEVRLRVMSQSGNTAPAVSPSGQSGAQQSSAPQQQQSSGQQSDTTTAQPAPAPAATDPTLSQSGAQVETIDLGDVTGTVCDCGEIPPVATPRGGFPWWLGFAGVPLICVSGICFGDEPEPECIINCGGSTPTPTPTPPIPEPATLILFGSGLLALGARARRRYGRKTGEDSTAVTAEEV